MANVGPLTYSSDKSEEEKERRREKMLLLWPEDTSNPSASKAVLSYKYTDDVTQTGGDVRVLWMNFFIGGG